jgi:putative SOS response-associated peptidase YedK
MCNLYSIKTKRADLARKFRLSDNRMAAFEPLPAIFPGHMAPIIKQSSDGERCAAGGSSFCATATPQSA